jgi:hypothetical protein
MITDRANFGWGAALMFLMAISGKSRGIPLGK